MVAFFLIRGESYIYMLYERNKIAFHFPHNDNQPHMYNYIKNNYVQPKGGAAATDFFFCCG